MVIFAEVILAKYLLIQVDQTKAVGMYSDILARINFK